MRRSRSTPRPRVLVVECDPTNLELMNEFLTAIEHEPLLAATAREARDRLDADGDGVGVLLTEISLESREDGLALTRELRADEQWRELPIIAVTGRAFPADRERALAAGCTACLTKPFSLRDLSDLLSDVDRIAPDAGRAAA
ncbi:MAG: response regulator [Candidatus Binatia bacterium]